MTGTTTPAIFDGVLAAHLRGYSSLCVLRPTCGMKMMAALLRDRREAADIMQIFAEEAARTGRNDPCPCGSGRKFKVCCGN